MQEGKMKTAFHICVNAPVCVCVCFQTSASDLQAGAGFPPAEDFLPDTQKCVATTFWSLSFPLWLFNPSSFHLLPYINLFLAPALSFYSYRHGLLSIFRTQRLPLSLLLQFFFLLILPLLDSQISALCLCFYNLPSFSSNRMKQKTGFSLLPRC